VLGLVPHREHQAASGLEDPPELGHGRGRIDGQHQTPPTQDHIDVGRRQVDPLELQLLELDGP